MVEETPLPDADSDLQLWPESLLVYDLTLAAAAENLALDEAFLSVVDANAEAACLRFWEPRDHFVVLGRSNRVETEVHVDLCKSDQIAILRRASGGGTVLVGPGCLCYTLALPLNDIHRAMGVSRVTSILMEKIATGIRSLLPDVIVRGTSDLVWQDRKFSGNAQRWLRNSFVHHGTLLYDFPLPELARYLNQPSRQPDYRQSRRHIEFVTNVPLSAAALKDCLISTWSGHSSECPTGLLDQARDIVASRYHSAEWNLEID